MQGSTTLSKKEDSFTWTIPTESTLDSGSRLYSFHLIVGHIGQLLCPNCKAGPLILHEKPPGIGVVGFHSELRVKCTRCAMYIAMTNTSDTLQNRTSVTNIRAVASAVNSGIGYSQLVKFFGGINVPQPMHQCTSADASSHISTVSCTGMLGYIQFR